MLFTNVFGTFTLGPTLPDEPNAIYIEWTYTNGVDVGPSFAEPQSGSGGDSDPVPIEIGGFIKIFHPHANPRWVKYGALIQNPNNFSVSFLGDVGDFQ